MVLTSQLRIPGPTPLPDRVLRSASRQLINHRGPEFAQLLSSITERLQASLFTASPVILIPGSGTFGLEAAIVNLLSPGDEAIFCTCGYFGERWIEIAKAYGIVPIPVVSPWGQATNPEQVKNAIAKNPNASTVFITHNETSTGVTNDLEELCKIVKSAGKLLAIDSVSGASSLPVRVDELGIDILVTATQKGWMAPPGLAMLTLSDEALAASRKSTSPKWCLDAVRYVVAAGKGQTLTTPPISTYYALDEGLAMIQEEGIENAWNRHGKVATMIRSGIVATGLKLFAPEQYRSNSVTSIYSPAPDAESLSALLALLRTNYGLTLAGGQGQLAGKIFRIGHLGFIDESDAYVILASLEQAMFEQGYLSRVGFAVPAAQSAANAWAFGQELVTADR